MTKKIYSFKVVNSGLKVVNSELKVGYVVRVNSQSLYIKTNFEIKNILFYK